MSLVVMAIGFLDLKLTLDIAVFVKAEILLDLVLEPEILS